MHTDHLNPDREKRARRLETDPQFRVLRAIPAPHTLMPPDGSTPEGRCIGIVDLETTGLDPVQDQIIELALMLVWIDEADRVIGHCGPLTWQQDPGAPLVPVIRQLTGLTDRDLRGRQINDQMVGALLARADLLVAHNAPFEIGWLERRYPQITGSAWACSMRDIDWLATGVDGRAQQHLLAQHGWFSAAHRAAADVWSLFWLLNQRKPDPVFGSRRTHLQRLVEGASAHTIMVQAERAPFASKDLLKARGYHWSADAKIWRKELPQRDVAHEQAWFYSNGLPLPTLRPISAYERHR